MKIGVLALQGAFIEHINMLKGLGVEVTEVRTTDNLRELDGLIIPGGESTVILKLLHDFGIYEVLKESIKNGMAVWGTCAGMIVLSDEILNQGRNHMKPLKAINITTERNAFGRQTDSFSQELIFKGIDHKVQAIFIRAPRIVQVDKKVDILSTLPDGTIVAAKQEKILVTSFHPELTADNSVHHYFCRIAEKQ